jgi:hypothetical protein
MNEKKRNDNLISFFSFVETITKPLSMAKNNSFVLFYDGVGGIVLASRA